MTQTPCKHSRIEEKVLASASLIKCLDCGKKYVNLESVLRRYEEKDKAIYALLDSMDATHHSKNYEALQVGISAISTWNLRKNVAFNEEYL